LEEREDKEEEMTTIKVIELIGTSAKNWEDAANNAVKEAQETVKGITGLEVVAQTAKVEGGEIVEYRTNVKVAFLVQDNR
jgi:flavin-binding protein dodecin